MDPIASELGWLETFLAEMPQSGVGSAVAKRAEIYRRMTRNGSYIDANDVIHFLHANFPSQTFGDLTANTVQVSGNTVIAGLAGFIANATANVISFIADTFTVGSNTTFLKDAELQAGASLQFSGYLTLPDAEIRRTGTGLLTLTANVLANGSFTANGLSTLGNTIVNGTLLANGAFTVNALSTLGNTIVNGTLLANGALTVNANSTLGNSVVNGTLLVQGVTTSNANVTVNGFVNIASTLQVAGVSTLTGNATFGGFANVGTTLQVAGVSTLTGNVTMSGFANVAGKVVCAGNVVCNGRLFVPVGTALY